MPKGVFAVEDVKAGEFATLHVARSNEAALRAFTDAILHGEDSMLRRYPDDYQLVRVGSFDEVTGELEGCQPQVISTAANVLRRADINNIRDDVAQLSLVGADGR